MPSRSRRPRSYKRKPRKYVSKRRYQRSRSRIPPIVKRVQRQTAKANKLLLNEVLDEFKARRPDVVELLAKTGRTRGPGPQVQ